MQNYISKLKESNIIKEISIEIELKASKCLGPNNLHIKVVRELDREIMDAQMGVWQNSRSIPTYWK